MVFNYPSAGALILNAGYEPVQVVGWKKAIILWLQGKVEVLEYHNASVSSPQRSFRLPSVLKLKVYIRPMFGRSKIKLSRQNVFIRDRHTCQYCLQRLPEKKLTIDHVIPISKGGQHVWDNVVAACASCNNRKGSRAPEEVGLKLKAKPKAPRWLPATEWEMQNDRVPPAWRPYLVLSII